MPRKILLVFGLILAVLTAGVLILPALVNVNRYRPQIEARLEERLGREVSLGTMRLKIIPLRFQVTGVVIEESPEFRTGRPFAQAEQIYLSPKLLPLLRRNLEIAAVELVSPRLELVRNEQGTWNFATLAAGRDSTGRPPSIDRLKIDDGQFAFTDLRENKPRAVYHHLDLLLRDFAPDKTFSVEGRMRVPGSGEQMMTFEGNAGPIQRDHLAQTPIEGKFGFSEVSLSGLQGLLSLAVLENSEAVLTGSANIRNDRGVFVSDGELHARSPKVRGVELGFPIAVKYDVQGNLNEKTAEIRQAELRLNATPIRLKGRVDTREEPPAIDLQVTTSRAPLAETARLAAALGLAFAADTQVDGSMTLNVHAKGPLNRPVLEGDAAAGNVRISGGSLRQPVHVDDVEISFSPDAIRSGEFTARTGSTSVLAQFALSAYSSGAPQLQASVSTSNADIVGLLDIAHAYGVSGAEGVRGTGTAQLNVAVSGPIGQPARLKYSGSGAVRNASFELESFAMPVAVRSADLRFNANSVVAGNLDMTAGGTVARGSVTLHNPAAPRVEFSLAADTINVPEWQALARSRGGRAGGDGLLGRISGRGSLTIDTVSYGQLVLNGLRSAVRLDRGVITLSPLTAGLYGGRQSGSIILDLRTDPPVYTADLALRQVDANRLLSSISTIEDALYGVLSADTETRFSGGGDAHAITRSLDGRISMNLKNGSIANMDLLHQLASIAQFARTGRLVEPVTKVGQLKGDFDIRDGVARTDNLEASFEAGSFAATGTVDLVQQQLDLRVTAVLSKEYSDAAGGTRIGGLMTTAVANQKGEIAIPVIVTGTFQAPVFAPDLQKVAQMKLEQAVPTADNPAELTIGILERIIRGKEPR